MKYNLFLYTTIIILLLSTTSCQQRKKEKAVAISANENFVSRPTPDHYWDQYDFSDTVTMKYSDVGEQIFVNFIGVLGKEPPEKRTAYIYALLTKAETDSAMFGHFMALSKKYLYHPNSPLYNESYYEAVLTFLIQSDLSDATDKLRARQTLDLIRKNNPGQQAGDFSFRLPDGKLAKMRDISAPFTVLLFYEPGCQNCEESIGQLADTPGFSNLLSNGEVKVLAVYASGDQKIWEDYQSSLPVDWINVFDEKMSVLNDDLYDLKASPTIYLLDKEKKVVLKDTDVSSLLHYFRIQ